MKNSAKNGTSLSNRHSADRAEFDSKEASFSSDRFDAAAKLLSATTVFTVLCLAAPLVVSFSAFESVETANLVRELNASDLSIVPSGRSPRSPESAERSVDLDFSPFLPLDRFDPKFLLIEPPESSKTSYGKGP